MMVIEYCPYCKKEHRVESRGFLAVQRVDGKYTCCYWCPTFKKEFKITRQIYV